MFKVSELGICNFLEIQMWEAENIRLQWTRCATEGLEVIGRALSLSVSLFLLANLPVRCFF